MPIVYMAKNTLTEEFYIGSTSTSLEKRCASHRSAALTGANDSPIAKAIRKHGYETFVWTILSVHDELINARDEEARLIKELMPHYNSTEGGGEYEAFRNHQRELASTPESRKLFAQYAHMGPQAVSRRVVCLNDGKVYESASAAAAAYGAKKSAVIEVCLRRPFRKQAAGRVFRYEGDEHDGAQEAAKISVAPNRRTQSGSRYKGVNPHINDKGEHTGRWRARLFVDRDGRRKNLHLGIFDTQEQAHEARLAAIASEKESA